MLCEALMRDVENQVATGQLSGATPDPHLSYIPA